MKRIALVFLCIALLVSLSGCIWIPVWEKPLNLYGDFPVTSVSLYQLDEAFPLATEDGKLNLDEAYSPVAFLSEEEMENFCEKMQKLEFRNDIVIILAAMDPIRWEYVGNLIRVDYENGWFEVICYDGTYWFDGKTHKSSAHCDTEEWDAFLAEYFPDDIGK